MVLTDKGAKADSVSSLEDILNIETPDELLDFLSSDSSIEKDVLVMTKRINRKSDQPDLRLSSREFIKNMHEKLCVKFGGVYINGDLNINAELDVSTGDVVYDKMTELNNGLKSADKAKLVSLEDYSRFVMPLKFRGTYFGNVVFDKKEFSLTDVAVIMDCVFEFSRRIHNSIDNHNLRKLVDRDSLTGLFNRRKFDIDYATYKQNLDNHGQQFAVIFGDVDYFKQINDRYGHKYGDYVLREVGALIMRNIREVDLPYRYGGDEFAVILPGASEREADTIARRVNDAVREKVFKSDLPTDKASLKYMGRRDSSKIRTTLSAASSETEGKGTDILQAADDRLILIKRYCKNAVISKSKRDIYTDVAGLRDFMDFLDNKIIQCNRDSRNLAVMLFDVVKFSEIIKNYGSDTAWDTFYSVARHFYEQRHHFDYVARVCDRDNMVVSMSSNDSPGEFYKTVQRTAKEWASKLSNTVWKIKGNDIKMDFAVGGCVYIPSGQTDREQFAKKPELLFGFAENRAGEAGDIAERIKIELYSS